VGVSLVLSACEASGDALGAAALRGLGAAGVGVDVRGIAGPRMAAAAEEAGLPLHAAGDTRDLGAAGLVELIPALPNILRARRTLDRLLSERTGPAVLIDGPDLHLPAARRAPRIPGRPIGLLVAPQYWAWRARRAERLHEAVDFVLCLFRFEAAHLRRMGVMAHWVGHPALDATGGPRAAPGAPPGRLVVAVLPGSRRGEITRTLRPALAGLAEALPDRRYEVIVPWRPVVAPPTIPGVTFTRDPGRDVLRRAHVAVVAAGTATLEAALLGLPTVVVARAHPLTAAIARRALRVPWVGLPNLVLQRGALPELVQDLSRARWVQPLRSVVADAERGAPAADAVRDELREVLGPAGFEERVAAVLGPLLERP